MTVLILTLIIVAIILNVLLNRSDRDQLESYQKILNQSVSEINKFPSLIENHSITYLDLPKEIRNICSKHTQMIGQQIEKSKKISEENDILKKDSEFLALLYVDLKNMFERKEKKSKNNLS